MGCSNYSTTVVGPRSLKTGVQTNEVRNFSTFLDEMNVIDFLGGSEDRKTSMGSCVDNNLKSFANKDVTQIGLDVPLCVGFTCRKGLKPRHPNQDSWTLMWVAGKFSLYAIFDGHGMHGHIVSDFVKEVMPKLILKDRRFMTKELPLMLKDVFSQMQNIIVNADHMNELNAQTSGTTATVCIHDRCQKKLIVAHVGDSACVLSVNKGEQLVAKQLTREHCPSRRAEKDRIEEAGGVVVYDGFLNHHCLYKKGMPCSGLNISRSLGDILAHAECGLTCEPDVIEYMLSNREEILCLCTEGVWEYMAPQEVVDHVKMWTPDMYMKAADSLAVESWDRWIVEEAGCIVDDITVLLAHLQIETMDTI